MKIEKMFVAFTLFLSVFFLSSCSDDDGYEPITLLSPSSSITVENGFANLQLTPFSSEQSLYIQGGDGQYVIENTDKSVVTVNYDGQTLVIKPTALGYTSIHIRDNSKNSLTIYINVDHLKTSYTVIQRFPYVVGDDLTIKEKKQLEEEIVADMSIATGGRYVFTYNSPDGAKGEVNIYPDRNSKNQKGSFVTEYKETEEGYNYTQITLRVNEKEWVFADVPYFNPNTRAVGGGDYLHPLMLVQNVTDNYKHKYPALEKAFAMQAYMR